MKLYKIYEEKLISANVSKETKCFYFLDSCIPAFGFSARIDKKFAMLTPQEAIQEALNGKKIMRGAFQERLAKIEAGLKFLEKLQKEYHC